MCLRCILHVSHNGFAILVYVVLLFIEITTSCRDRGFRGKCLPSVSVTNITQLLCSFSATGLEAYDEAPVRHAMFWTATPENVHLRVIRVTRSVEDTWLPREMSTVCVCVCVSVCVCVCVCVEGLD